MPVRIPNNRAAGITDRSKLPLGGLPSSLISGSPVMFEDGGAVGDGVTDDSAAIANAYAAAVKQGRSLAASAGKQYAIYNRIDLSAALAGLASPPPIILGSATIVQARSTNIFYASATASESVKTALTVAVNAGDQTITLPAGAGASFQVGSWIAVQCLAGVFGLPGSNLGYPREIKQVLSISGDTLTVDSPYVFAYPITATPYSSGNSAYYSKLAPLNAPEITGGKFRNPNLAGLEAGTSNGYLARWEQCHNVRMFDIQSDQMGGGILCVECMGVKITGDFNRHQYQNDPNNPGQYGAPWGYGVGLVGCCRDGEIDITGRACRHLYTTLGNNFTGANTPGSGGGNDPNSPDGQWYIGGPMGIKVRGVGEGDTLTPAVWDTHPYGWGHDFDVTAIGGQVGFQCRDLRTTGRIVASGQNGTSGVSTINGSVGSDLTVDVSGVIGPATKAVAIDGTDNTIRGRIHDNSVLGVALSATATRPTVAAHILNNANYGVQDLGATNPLILGCYIPKGTSQTVSVLNLGATGRVAGGTFTGYGAGATGMSGTNASAQVAGVTVDSGFTSSVVLYPGGSAGGNPATDVNLYRGGSNLLRTGAMVLGDRGLRDTLNVTISGRTSAQIDTAVGAFVTAADGQIATDVPNHMAAIRLNGAWYPFTLTGPL